MSSNKDQPINQQQLIERFLNEVGLSNVPPDQRQDFIKHIKHTIQLRIGQRISKFLEDSDLIQFQEYMQTQQHQKAKEFLNQKAPNHGQIVKEEIAKLQEEIRTNAYEILESFKEDS